MLDERSLLEAWSTGRIPGVADRAALGERNRRLLSVHHSSLGGLLACSAACPECEQLVEVELASRSLLARGAKTESDEWHEVPAHGKTVRYRIPTPDDLRSARAMGSVQRARAALISRCVDPSEPTSEQLDAVGADLERRDPLAVPAATLSCPQCGHRWSAPLDVERIVRAGIDASARRLLAEIAALGRAYGWTEPEVLEVPAARRRAYIALAEGGS